MSTNDKLEFKVNELTNAVRGLSDKPALSVSDLNDLLENVVSKVEETNEESFTHFANELSESLIDVLDKKTMDIKEKLSLFQEFIASVEKTIDNPKINNEVTRILNDIEAVHSKMNSQEIQMEELLKSFESVKNSSNVNQVSKLCDEIVEISKSYDGITEVLNKNFQDFIKRVEATSSREEFQRLRFNMENLDNNQNILVSAMNSINEKQDEIKNIIKQSSYAQNSEKLEHFQDALNQMNRLIIETTSKADIEIISDKISSLSDLINEFRRAFDENNQDGIKGVLNGQLNNISARLEELKMNSNSSIGEDIIRLYTSIAEFKDNIYSSINSQLNDIVNSLDVKFDKITNSVVNTTLDSNESLNNLTGEIQKLTSIVTDGLNTKAYELKENFEKQGQNNVITIVNSIRGELSNLVGELDSLNNSDGIAQLLKSIENLRNGIDINSIIIQMDQIKSALDFTPIKEQLALLNKDETINSINEKINVVLGYVRNNDFLDKLEEIKNISDTKEISSALNILNDKIDFSSIEDKIEQIKEYLENSKNENKIEGLEEKLNKIEEITAQTSAIKNIEDVISEMRDLLEENIKMNLQKFNEDKEAAEGIKDALQVIHNNLESLAQKNNNTEELSEIKDSLSFDLNKIFEIIQKINDDIQNKSDLQNENIKAQQSNIEELIENSRANLENSLNVLSDKINYLDSKINIDDREKLVDIKEEIENLYEFLKKAEPELIFSEIKKLKEEFSSFVLDNFKEFSDVFDDFKSRLASDLETLKESAQGGLDEANLNNFFLPMLENFNSKIAEKIDFLTETIINDKEDSAKVKSVLSELTNSIEKDIKNSLIETLSEVIQSKTELVYEIINNQTSDINEQVAGYLKDEIEALTTFLQENLNNSKGEIITKIQEIIDVKDKIEEKLNVINPLNDDVKSVLNDTSLIKEKLEENKNILNETNEKIGVFEAQFSEAVEKLTSSINEINLKEALFSGNLEIKKLVGRINESLGSINSTISNDIANKSSLTEISEQLKEAVEEVKSEIENQFARNEDNANSIANLTSLFEEKLNSKIALLEGLIEESSGKVDNKINDVINSNRNLYNKALSENSQGIINALKTDYEGKLTDIQKIIDEKVFDIISKNNDIIKDELKYRADLLLREMVKGVQEKLTEMNEDTNEGEPQYSIKDVEGDLAKIRLALEKTNKLTNFKEFASRLVELKNINLENAKISRVIGADIMRFDGWLKNTTAKIELLAAKIEKSEKIKMEDLKTRLIQSEKNQAMPQKIEEVVMSIYKRYRSQETKIDDLSHKIESLSDKQSETFDVKEFIDLFYDTTKKQENIMSRMDSIEDKMDLIQAKIDHIIDACISE